MSSPRTTPTAESRRVPNRLAIGLIAVGAVLGVLALTVLDWFHGDVGLVHGAHSTVGDIGNLIDRLVDTRQAVGDRSAIRLGLSDYYYDWLAWVMLVAAVVVATVAMLPTAEGGQVRALGGILAGLGLLATLAAFDIYRTNVPLHGTPRHYADDKPASVPATPGYGHFLSHLSVGAFAILVAFVLIGVGAVLGPRRLRD